VIQPYTVVIPLLNGVDVCERMRAILSSGIIFPACIYVGTHIEKPGVATQAGGDAKVLFGPPIQSSNR
jgi:2-dehydropantoate 2-reductase